MPDWLPEAASSYAGKIDGLLIMITVIVGVWFLVAEGLLVYMAVRYRRREGQKAAYLPARSLRAMSWVLVPCAVILVLDLVIDAAAAPVWAEIKETLPPHDRLVRITGAQWMWNFQYAGPDGLLDTDDDFETINELHAPIDQVVQFQLGSKDVLHSFWVPQLRLKQDAVPGRRIRGWFKATREGRYPVVCAEICGVGHTMMQGMLHVESVEAYEEWRDFQVGAARERRQAQEGGSS
jgi:cytochrome c oxidase subunit 2